MAFTVRTDDELEAALDDLTRRENLSRQEVIRRAVLDRHARTLHQGLVADAASRQHERWATLLQRLGTA
jgi:predicted transcriptional regulator